MYQRVPEIGKAPAKDQGAELSMSGASETERAGGSGRPPGMELVDFQERRKSKSRFSYSVLPDEFSDTGISKQLPVCFS